MKELYNAVCNNDLDFVEEYYNTADASSGDTSNYDTSNSTADNSGIIANNRSIADSRSISDNGGIVDTSLIMTALRNGHVAMIRLLEKHGETILDTEIEEYESRIEPLYASHYKDIVENFLRGNPLHLEFEYDEKNSLSSLCKVTSPEYPEFQYIGKYVTGKIGYYALCEWIRQNRDV